jgi:hypothetical protein
VSVAVSVGVGVAVAVSVGVGVLVSVGVGVNVGNETKRGASKAGVGSLMTLIRSEMSPSITVSGVGVEVGRRSRVGVESGNSKTR